MKGVTIAHAHLEDESGKCSLYLISASGVSLVAVWAWSHRPSGQITRRGDRAVTLQLDDVLLPSERPQATDGETSRISHSVKKTQCLGAEFSFRALDGAPSLCEAGLPVLIGHPTAHATATIFPPEVWVRHIVDLTARRLSNAEGGDCEAQQFTGLSISVQNSMLWYYVIWHSFILYPHPTRHTVGPVEDKRGNGMIIFWSYFEKNELILVCMHTCLWGVHSHVATECPLSLSTLFLRQGLSVNLGASSWA